MKNDITISQNSFIELDNARNLSKEQLVDTFIPTTVFFRLLSKKHHIIFGARGQGKTAIAKMLSFDHLSSYAHKDKRIKDIIDKQEYIGIYLPIRVEYFGLLQTKPWNTSIEKEALFQWKINLMSCMSFLKTAQACVQYYVENEYERIIIERKLCKALAGDWDITTTNYTFQELKRQMEDVSYFHQLQLLKDRILSTKEASTIGIPFLADLFVPLKHAIVHLMRTINFNQNCAWILCIDEAEYLDSDCQKILNSFMRTFSDNLFLMIATMPFCHYTLATTNGDIELNAGQDFEYISMDNDILSLKDSIAKDSDESEFLFGSLLFKKIYESHFSIPVSDDAIFQLLGPSILDPKANADTDDMVLFERYASPATKKRAEKLRSKSLSRFHNEITRKMHGAMHLRNAVSECKGNKSLSVYSGAKMFIRCAEKNPRRLIRLFNLLFVNMKKTGNVVGHSFTVLSPSLQTNTLTSFSETTLNQIRSLEEVGPELYDLLVKIGRYMQFDLHNKPLSTDQICSIETTDKISDSNWKLIQKAVEQGLLITNAPESINYGVAAVRAGKYHLAYILSPYFRLLPRKGKSVKLSTIIAFDSKCALKALPMSQDDSDDMFSNWETDDGE